MVKKGFTLAETLVVIAIVSIFFSFAAKVITTKPKPRRQSIAHGYFECYIDGGLKQRMVQNGVPTEPKNMSGSCKFTPVNGVSFYNINSYNPSFTKIEPNIAEPIFIAINPGNTITFSKDGDSYTLESDETISDENDTFFETVYPDSKMCNYNGQHCSMRSGVMISW